MRAALLCFLTGAALFAQGCDGPPDTTSAPNQLEGRDPVTAILAARAVPVAPATLAEWTTRAQALRERVRRDAGLVYPRVLPGVTVLGTRTFGGVTLQDLIIEGYEGMDVPAALYLPAGASAAAKVPGVLVNGGHDGPAGMAAGTIRTVAWSLALDGVAVLTTDWLGMGTRFADDQRHIPMGFRSLLAGLPPAVPALDEPLRAFDVLASLPEIDPARLGMVGQSGGGMVTLHLAALDERVAVAVSVDYLAPSDYMLTTDWGDPDAVLLNLLAHSSSGELAALVAPRPMLVISGDDDKISPTAAMDRELGIVRAVYGLYGASAAIAHEGFPVAHCWCDQKIDAALAFLGQQLVGHPIARAAIPGGSAPAAAPRAGNPRWPDLVLARWAQSPVPPSSAAEVTAILEPLRARLAEIFVYAARPVEPIDLEQLGERAPGVALLWLADAPDFEPLRPLVASVTWFVGLTQPTLLSYDKDPFLRYLTQKSQWVGRTTLALAVEDIVWAAESARQAGASKVVVLCEGERSALACAAAAAFAGAPDAFVLRGMPHDFEQKFVLGAPDPTLYFGTPGLGGAATPEMLVVLAAPRPVALLGSDSSDWVYAPAAFAALGAAGNYDTSQGDSLVAVQWAIDRVGAP